MGTTTDGDYLAQLRRTLEDRFNESELQTFCADLTIDYDSLPGTGKADKARELVAYCKRHDMLRVLVAKGKVSRPDIPWRDPPAPSVVEPGEVASPTGGVPVRNPFWHRGPIRDPAFFTGRSSEVRTAMSLLPNAQSISLVGPRHIGKTSLLYYISNPTVLEASGIDPKQFVFVFGGRSCEQLSEHSRSQFLQLMLDEARAGVNQARFLEETTASPTSVATFYDFAKALERLTKFGGTLVFLFDEFEYLAQNKNLDPAFFAGLRSIASNLRVAYVASSARSLLDLTYADKSVLGSPFFNIFSTIRIGLFEDSAARELIGKPSSAAGVVFSDATVEYILSLADHHPFFIQIACFHAFEMQSRNGVLTEADYPLLRERAESELQNHLQYAWDHLGEEGQQVLLSSETAWEDPKVRHVLEILNDQGVICQSGNRFRWCSLWANFVQSLAPKVRQ